MGDSTGEDITYREYYNRGGDETMTGRVNWKGYKFIKGNARIPQIGVSYYGGLALT